jgi:hypothetical protein
MVQPARGLALSRDTQISRRGWLLASLAAPLFFARAAQLVDVTFDGDNLRVSASDLHFLRGKALERIKNGSTVVFATQLTLFSDRFVTILKRSSDRFDVSHDIWSDDDKFYVTIPGAKPVTVFKTSADATEAWCLDNLAITAAGLLPDRLFWLRLEMTVVDPKSLAKMVREPGISLLPGLIEVFGKKPGAEDSWTREAGPLRLADLAHTPGRGRRG